MLRAKNGKNSIGAAYCLPPTACRRLPTASCVLPTAFCRLPSAPSTLHAKHLLQRVDNINQVALRFHHLVDVFVGAGDLVDHALILATLDAFRLNRQIIKRELPLRRSPRHLATGAVAARAVRVQVSLAAHDEASRAHATGNDSELAVSRRDCALARDPKPLSKMLLERCVVVVAVNRLLHAFDLALHRLA